jgi:hypothetical protein
MEWDGMGWGGTRSFEVHESLYTQHLSLRALPVRLLGQAMDQEVGCTQVRLGTLPWDGMGGKGRG